MYSSDLVVMSHIRRDVQPIDVEHRAGDLAYTGSYVPLMCAVGMHRLLSVVNYDLRYHCGADFASGIDSVDLGRCFNIFFLPFLHSPLSDLVIIMLNLICFIVRTASAKRY